MADERCSTELKEVKSKTETDMKLIQQLHDSISILKTELEKEKIKNRIDTIKTKPVVTPKKK